jgi:hypothetical protein
MPQKRRPQQRLGIHRVTAVRRGRGRARRRQALQQVLDPDRACHRRIADPCDLVCHIQVDVAGTIDHCGGAPEVPGIGPGVIIVKKAEIIAARLLCPRVQCVAGAMAVGAADQRQEAHALA